MRGLNAAPLLVLSLGLSGARPETPPNLVLILADDLGYGEVGCYGQKKIRTPNIDRMAAEGMRFTQAYSGNAVCAPSRCVLLTGLHPGHAAVRDNREVKPEGQHPLPDGAVTVAELLKSRGYATGVVGKWGLGPPGSEGDPLRQGFDFFFGYNCQRQAHNYYPAYLWRNGEKIVLEGNDGKSAEGKQYSHDLVEKEGLDFIRSRKGKPFFLFMAFTIPHLALQVPEDSLAEYRGQWEDPPYAGDKGYQPHPAPRAAYAAMVSRLDRSVGRVTALLKELGLEEDTLVLFSSDNGPTHGGVGGSDSEFFSSAGPFRGLKGSLYEGGIRVPLIARWPGKVRAGSVIDLPCAFQDVLPTFCEIAGAEVPKGIDGISILPTLLGKEGQKRREYLYWEFPGYGGQQAVRWGDWKGVRQNMNKGSLEIHLYNLADDIGESKNVAAANPDVVARIAKIMAEEHAPSDLFPLKPLDAPK